MVAVAWCWTVLHGKTLVQLLTIRELDGGLRDVESWSRTDVQLLEVREELADCERSAAPSNHAWKCKGYGEEDNVSFASDGAGLSVQTVPK